MKLFYRSLSYEYNSSQAAKKATRPFAPVRHQGSAYNLTYRGLTYHVDPNIEPAEVSTQPVVYQLIYRGTSYTVNRTAQGEISVVSQPTSATKLNKMSVARDLKLQQ